MRTESLQSDRIAIDRDSLDMRDRRHRFSICAAGNDHGNPRFMESQMSSMKIFRNRPIASHAFRSAQAIRKTVYSRISSSCRWPARSAARLTLNTWFKVTIHNEAAVVLCHAEHRFAQ